MAKPLKGVRVLDMGTFITGPAAGVLLADLGAEVIKVEMPGTGDPFRAFKGDLYSPHYQTYNRNKKSIELNTKEPEDLAAFDALVKDADVFIQNFRPGVAERLGVGPERLRALNPRLIYCGISGFGNDGPWKDRPAFDTVSQAVTGFLRLLVNPANPRVVGPAIGDAVTGFYAAFGVLAALYLEEYAPRNRWTDLIEVSINNLAAVPSIIFGLFGFIFFVSYLKMSWSILAGSLTLALMILPTIIRTAEEAIRAVPQSYREVSFGMGATRWQMVTTVVLPTALPGILTGIILAFGRAVGETAAVIFTAGTALNIPISVFSPVRTMAVHFYILAVESLPSIQS